jgi:ankyrin repeat protein
MSSLKDFAEAIENGDSAQVKLLLSGGSIDVNARLPRRGYPPALVFAASKRWVEIIEMLLSAGADIDGVDDEGRTACHCAVWLPKADVLAALLAHRPNLELRDRFHRTPLEATIEYDNDPENILSLMFINAGASLDGLASQLFEFASRSTATIQALLNRGVDVSQLRDGEDHTPLHAIAFQSACSGDLDTVVKMLINVCGVDLEARTSYGQTCAQVASNVCNYEALRCFINAGADVNCVDRHVMGEHRCTRCAIESSPPHVWLCSLRLEQI